MDIWYTSRYQFNKENSGWDNYIKWSKLNHVIEIITLDTNLGDVTFKPDMELEDTYQFAVNTDNLHFTNCYNDLNYVLCNNIVISNYNLLAVVLNPTEPCENIKLDNFRFIGYDLMDQSNNTSALTNCGGLSSSFSSEDLNEYGLVNTFDKAYKISQSLFDNNPEEYHADTNVWHYGDTTFD